MIIFANRLMKHSQKLLLLFQANAKTTKTFHKKLHLLAIYALNALILCCIAFVFCFHRKVQTTKCSSICIRSLEKRRRNWRVHILVLNVFSQESKMNVPEEICKSAFFLTTSTVKSSFFLPVPFVCYYFQSAFTS